MSTPELIAPGRLEELLGGAVPDTHAEARLQGLALELRSGAPGVSEDLRRRVHSLAVPQQRRRILASRRRLALVLALVVLAIVAPSVVLGRLEGSTSSPLRSTERGVPNLTAKGILAPAVPDLTRSIVHGELAQTTRARHVDMWIEVRVRDADRLSAAANDAMRITRELGGFVTSSTVGTRGREGRAEITIHLPVEKVDDALFRISQLGSITSQRVVTEDRQAQIDRASQRIETLRRAIRIARLRLESGTLSGKERLELQIKLERLRSQLASMQKTDARLHSDAATADLTLLLHTQEASGKSKESAVGGMIGDALHVLGRIGLVALFAAIVLSPLALLALLAWLVRRRRLQREQKELLDQTRPGTPSPQPPPA